MILKKLCRASKRSIMGIMALAAVSSMVISGCGSNKGTVSETSTQAQPQSAAAENNEGSAQEQKVMKLAATLMPDTSPIKCLTDMSVKLKDETQGAVDIQIFPASQLGGQRDFVEGVSMGTVEMCIVGVGALESFEPRFPSMGCRSCLRITTISISSMTAISTEDPPGFLRPERNACDRPV